MNSAYQLWKEAFMEEATYTFTSEELWNVLENTVKMRDLYTERGKNPKAAMMYAIVDMFEGLCAATMAREDNEPPQ